MQDCCGRRQHDFGVCGVPSEYEIIMFVNDYSSNVVPENKVTKMSVENALLSYIGCLILSYNYLIQSSILITPSRFYLSTLALKVHNVQRSRYI